MCEILRIFRLPLSSGIHNWSVRSLYVTRYIKYIDFQNFIYEKRAFRQIRTDEYMKLSFSEKIIYFGAWPRKVCGLLVYYFFKIELHHIVSGQKSPVIPKIHI